jgi:hypothetical protein
VLNTSNELKDVTVRYGEGQGEPLGSSVKVCKVEQVIDRPEIRRATTQWIPKSVSGSRIIPGWNKHIPAQHRSRNAFKITLLTPPPAEKVKTMPLVEDATCFEQDQEYAYDRAMPTKHYEKAFCPGKSLTLNLPKTYSFHSVDLTLSRPVQGTQDINYLVALDSGIGGRGADEFRRTGKNKLPTLCSLDGSATDQRKSCTVRLGNINTGAENNTIEIQNKGSEPFFITLKTYSTMATK